MIFVCVNALIKSVNDRKFSRKISKIILFFCANALVKRLNNRKFHLDVFFFFCVVVVSF